MAKKTQTQRQNPSRNGASDADENVEKIRDILFGGQMRDYEKRFDDLEKRLTAHMSRLSGDFEKRIERLETYARREVGKLGDQFKAERKDRIADHKSGMKDLQSLSDQVETWFGEVEEQLETEAKDLRASLHDQNEGLATEIRQTREDLSAALAEETRGLGDAKLAREDLAEMLTEVALRLRKDFKLPK